MCTESIDLDQQDWRHLQKGVGTHACMLLPCIDKMLQVYNIGVIRQAAKAVFEGSR